MGESTHIQWCDHTFNPWEGCTKVSPGCANCYAETRNHRFGNDNWGKGKPRRRTSAANWRLPLKWQKLARYEQLHTVSFEVPRPRVFCASLADWLDDVPIEWLADLLKLIYETPNLDWLMLTKRPQNWRRALNEIALGVHQFGKPMAEWERGFEVRQMAKLWIEDGTEPSNVWFGVSVENQKTADERIPILLSIPARVRFLSVEPMLEPVDLHRAMPCGYYCDERVGHVDHQTLNGIHWVIFGGESGPKARPCHVDWIRDGVMQCKAAGVSTFVKQLGSNPKSPVNQPYLNLTDKKGGDPTEWPNDLRVREFPK